MRWLYLVNNVIKLQMQIVYLKAVIDNAVVKYKLSLWTKLYYSF